MVSITGNSVFYGLENCEEGVENIIDELNLKELYFEIKLIIFEALTNAFIHGNKKDKSKPISLKWCLKDKALKIYITDCGSGIKEIADYGELLDDGGLLAECGRGLFIIKNYTDEMYIEGNSIIMTKYVWESEERLGDISY